MCAVAPRSRLLFSASSSTCACSRSPPPTLSTAAATLPMAYDLAHRSASLLVRGLPPLVVA
eukprot:2752669-Prymnesium_polylepis.1